MPDFEAIRGGLQQAIPFNAHLGLRVMDVAPGRGVVRLPDDERLRNHVGSQHAGALFAAGQLAAGAAVVGTFAQAIGDVAPAPRSARIEHRDIARGPLLATATLDGDGDALLGRLREEGAVRFTVDVELTDARRAVVATMTVDWHVSPRA